MTDTSRNDEAIEATSPDQAKRKRMRSIAIALALGFMVVLFYAATIVRIGGNVANKAF